MTYKFSHKPVLLEEFLNLFDSQQINIFVDATLGAGGHSRAILDHHPEIKKLIGIDGDPQALETASHVLETYKDKISLVQGNFRHLKSILKGHLVDGIFFDIGISSMQLDESDRGFSFMRDAPLDMRKDPTLEIEAKDVVNSFSEEKLGKIFRELGEERRWRAAAKAICTKRKKKRIETTFDLIDVLKDVIPRQGRIHPMTLIFQALRIFVNDELKSLEEGILQGIESLAQRGRLGVVSFHSLEDRIVKNLFRESALKGEVRLLTKKPIMTSRKEIKINARARSSRMRFIEKL